MSTYTCGRCDGRGFICVRCLKPHAERGSYFRTRCRGRKTIACPGTVVTPARGEVVRIGVPPKVIPHFETHTECDVCKVTKRGDLFERVYGRVDSNGWQLINMPDGKTVYLCLACHKRHEEIRTMTLEYLMGDRGGLNGGRWVDRNGALLPDASPSGASTPQPGRET